MKDKIKNLLGKIAILENIIIIYACESGSRAWGFASEDSDYDVRFIYVRKPQDYFTVFPYRDVIDRNKGNEITSKMIRKYESHNIDVVGFDIKKTMELISKGNAGINEWLMSYQVYMEHPLMWTPIKQLSNDAFRLKAGLGHYLALARNHFGKCFQSKHDEVKLKNYLYVIRAVYACQYIINYKQYPPSNIDEMISNPRMFGADSPLDIQAIASTLVHKKQHMVEKGVMAKNEQLNSWLGNMIDSYEREMDTVKEEKLPEEIYTKIDKMFYDLVCSDRYGIK